jgi:hypothetical protein
MKVISRIQPTIDIIDEGLRLYRRGFLGFLLISSLWLVPVVIAVGISIAAVHYWGETAFLLLLLLWVVLAIPLMLYLVAGISRATLAVQDDRAVHLREVLAIPPLQFMGMGCYSIIFAIAANIITSAFSMFCFCPVYMLFIAFFTSIGTGIDEGGALGIGLMILLAILTSVAFLFVYGVALVLSGASYTSLIYAIQPFVLGNISFGKGIDRSVNLIFYRFGQNVIAFALTSIVFAALALAVSVAIGMLLPLPLMWALGEDSAIAQGSGAIAWLIGLIVVLPPVPIWMVLLYQRNTASHDGHALSQRIAELEP